MSLRLRIFLGNACLLVVASLVSLGVVFNLADRLAGDQNQAARQVIERSLERLRQAEAGPRQAGAGSPEREALLELNRILARGPVTQKDLMLEAMAWFLGFLILQLLALVGLSALLASSVAKPLERLTEGIRHASRRQSGYLLPALPGLEFARIGSAFNLLLGELDAQSALLAEQSRLAAWQEVAGFLSHQLKNPLTAIGFAISNAREAAGSPQLATRTAILGESLGIIDLESRRLAALVQRFRAGTTCPDPQPEEVPLAALVAAVQARLAEHGGPDGQPCRIGWDSRFEPGLTVHADRQLLEEVMANLCTNSLEAGGGAVDITIAARRAGPDTLIEQSDSAPPLADDIFDRILREPFTTKAAGQGLGLMFVRLVMARHGGSVSARRDAAGRLVFVLRLPGGL